MPSRNNRFVFQGGEIIRLLGDRPALNLEDGDQGYVWGVYDTEPPMYEATFYPQEGTPFDMTFAAEEVQRVVDSNDVRIPDSE